ncbi:MAG: membrane protein insertion efficiency factor YidD [Opitutales bacterium]|nr:membrane protein insertion efficiency factor YidD [Opitutales bacterium]
MIERFFANVFCKMVRLYQRFLSPLHYSLYIITGIPCACRFHPTCSEYARQCFQKHSIFRAFWFILKRIARCQPWCRGGYDPVP